MMMNGILFALGSCFCWGWVFVIPQFMTGFTSIEIALGRYFVYGILSCCIFCQLKFRGRHKYSYSIWIKAFYFSLISTVGCYTFLVLCLRYASPVICTLVFGASPITIAFYGNWKERETSFRSLIIPSVLILIGLVIVNISHLEKSLSPSSFVLGLVCGFLALCGWSWYVVANSQFLKRHSEVRSGDWSTLIGVATLFWVAIFALFLGLFFDDYFHIEKYLTFSSELKQFLVGCTILGLLCSWVGVFLWNRAALYLPVSLAGQLTIFETIFGVCFVYMLKQSMPSFMESIGIFLFLLAIGYGIKQFSKRKSYDEDIVSH